MSMGMDSLMAVEFKNRMTKSLGSALSQPLPSTLIFNYPNIEAISLYLLSDVLSLEEKKVVQVFKRKKTEEPIAIVGMSCRFPGGANSSSRILESALSGNRRDFKDSQGSF